MDEKRRMSFALISGIVIFATSVAVAYVFFSILESSAEASLQNWKLGGAFAGFVFTATLLTSIVFQVYKQMTADQISKYRDQILELQAKLVKGAPRPEKFVIEVDEKHKIVFSRPEDWRPKQGLLFQFIEKPSADEYPANFNLTYYDKNDLSDFYSLLKQDEFNEENVNVSDLYEKLIDFNIQALMQALKSYEKASLTKEFIDVDGNRSVKTINTFNTRDTEEGGNELRLCQCAVYTYVPRLTALFQFTFSDQEDDFLRTSEVFNNVIQSIRFLP